MHPRFCLAALLLLAAPLSLRAQTVVDIVPAAYSNEKDQNSEPNIAVNPLNSDEIVISAFGNRINNNPLYYSQNGGSTWAVIELLRAADVTLAWSDSGIPFLAKLSGGGNTMAVGKVKPARGKVAYFSLAYYQPGPGGPDQPWIFANNVAGKDHLYVGFNDLSKPARTASIRLSRNGGRTWRNVVIERVRPGDSFDGSAIRTAGVSNIVYAVFQRNNQSTPAGDEVGDVVVVKDVNSGANDFRDLGTDGKGVIAATGQTFPYGNLGHERLGSDVSIAVDPSDSDRVFIAYARLVNNAPQINVLRSINGGASWTSVFSTSANTALPALAVAGNGTVGLLFTKFTGGNLETHFTQSATNFSSSNNTILSRFPDGDPAEVFDPYIGDYQDLQAVGQTFFGTFSASNDVSQFPAAITVTFQRDQSRLLNQSVKKSIDPFFFKITALNPP